MPDLSYFYTLEGTDATTLCPGRLALAAHMLSVSTAPFFRSCLFSSIISTDCAFAVRNLLLTRQAGFRH